jgi:hypothetical protein
VARTVGVTNLGYGGSVTNDPSTKPVGESLLAGSEGDAVHGSCECWGDRMSKVNV